MPTVYYSHEDCLKHITSRGHPEQIARLIAIEKNLSESRFDDLMRRPAPVCDMSEIERCHPQSYIDRLLAAVPDEGYVSFDPDTHLSPGSLTAARRAIGGNLAAIDTVLQGEAGNAFVGCRPPGHHAEAEIAMGFCLFGTVAIAAKYALDQCGLNRVAIIDFDVHHGNGTQALLWDEPRSLFCSSHQMPLYPGTGTADETGADKNVLNVPLSPETGSSEMRDAYEQIVFPAIDSFAPELIFISAGFDAHQADPLANLNWTNEDYVWLTQRICDLADQHCHGRVVSTLEGGYDLTALGECVAAHVGVLMERSQ